MKLIIGLGNPGVRYENTRHNAGFMVMDELSKKAKTPIEREKFEGKFAKMKIKGEDVIFLKPETFMNNSGFSVRQVMDYFKIAPQDILLIYDDKDLPVGSIRLRQKGSAGGHNGVKSVINCIFTDEFDRIRVGIGKPDIPIIDFVLSKFKEEEKEDLKKGIEQAANAAWYAIDHDFGSTMNRYNKKDTPKKKKKEEQASKSKEPEEKKPEGKESGRSGNSKNPENLDSITV